MRAVLAASVVASALCLVASTAFALSLGPVTNATRLGQPLDFTVAVKLDAGDRLGSSCVTADVTAGDNHVPASQVRTRLLRARGESDAFAHVTTTGRLNEPVVTVMLSLGCPPKLSHKFVSLLDPPLGGAATGRANGPAVLRSAASKPLPPAGVDMPTAAATVSSPPPEPPAADRAAWPALEERLARQEADNQATRQALAGVQARLRELELAQRTDPVIYGLTVLVLMLLAVIALLLWRLMLLQKQRVWDEGAAALTEAPNSPPARGSVPAMPPVDEVTMTSMRVMDTSTRDGQDPVTVRETAPAISPASARVRHDLSSEELVDLEQQADFFIVLGQEDAAIDLLMGHVRSSGGTSPMPYLKLLEIYRRRGDADAYDRIRERFNRRFNAQAPAWETDPRNGRTLESYPDVMEQLQTGWSDPSSTVARLEALLFRRDSSAETFELPAYEELLFLYAVSRDEFEHEDRPEGVDLLLPLGEVESVVAIQHAQPSRAPVDLPIDITDAQRKR